MRDPVRERDHGERREACERLREKFNTLTYIYSCKPIYIYIYTPNTHLSTRRGRERETVRGGRVEREIHGRLGERDIFIYTPACIKKESIAERGN